MLNYSIHARERVLEFFAEKELDRLVQLACAAAEKSRGWQAGEEFIFEIEEQQYAYPGIELSALIVCHKGATYKVFYYDGPMAETITANCSWDPYGQVPPSGA
jgi:hypothetical protein